MRSKQRKGFAQGLSPPHDLHHKNLLLLLRAGRMAARLRSLFWLDYLADPTPFLGSTATFRKFMTPEESFQTSLGYSERCEEYSVLRFACSTVIEMVQTSDLDAALLCLTNTMNGTTCGNNQFTEPASSGEGKLNGTMKKADELFDCL